MRILFYFTLALIAAVLIRNILTRNGRERKAQGPPFRWLAKTNREIWVQVYDTDSFGEAKSLQARLEEDEVACFVYEQGRKDVHGNALKGFGIAVPRTSVSLAQKIIARMPV